MGVFTETVPRDLHEQALHALQRAEERLSQSVPVASHASIVQTLTSALERAQAQADRLIEEMASLKRHDVGLQQAGFDPSVHDPMKSLGPKTQLAIDDFAAGDPQVRGYLIGRAHLELAALRMQITDDNERDAVLAGMIRDGDS